MSSAAIARTTQIGNHLQNNTVGMAPHITVHALTNSRSQRVIWLLEELSLPYDVILHKRNPETQRAPSELRALHPLGKSPVVVIKDGGEENVLAESGAIVEYLIEKYGEGKMAPPVAGGADRQQYLHWMHYAEGSFMLYSILALVFNGLPKKGHWLMKPVLNVVSAGALSQFVKPNLDAQLKYVNDYLEGKTYFIGEDLTGVDIMMSFALEAFADKEVERFPNLKPYVDRLRVRPAWHRAEERGDKVDLSAFF